MAETVELRFCPFCGGKAEIVTNYEYGLARGYFVYCTCCGITQDHKYSTKKCATNAWNRRVRKVK